MKVLSQKAQSYLHRLENSFFGWWIVNYKVSFLVIILVILYGLYIAFTIPKESSPDIKFGVVSVTTVYPWANPVDVDDIITSKIEEKLKDIDGVDSISSTSSLGVSNVVITLNNGVDVPNFLNDARSNVDSVSLPEQATAPSIQEISTANEVLFQMILYGPKDEFSMNHLRSLAFAF